MQKKGLEKGYEGRCATEKGVLLDAGIVPGKIKSICTPFLNMVRA